ncbi:unnamed protein product, partial [Scytosiphon promiscuus]
LNDKQQPFVDIVVEHSRSVDACQHPEAMNTPTGSSSVREWPQPLRLILTGTAGTGKTVAINEIVRLLGRRRISLLAPTGNAAVAIGGQVRNAHVFDS